MKKLINWVDTVTASLYAQAGEFFKKIGSDQGSSLALTITPTPKSSVRLSVGPVLRCKSGNFAIVFK